MKPVYQTRFGEKGNCFEACIASLLEIPLEDVVDLGPYEEDFKWITELNKWLDKYGLNYICVKATPELLEEYDFYHLLLGKTSKNSELKHAVIGYKGKPVFNPNGIGADLLYPEDGLFTVGLFVKIFH